MLPIQLRAGLVGGLLLAVAHAGAAQESHELERLTLLGLPVQHIELPEERLASLELPVFLGDEPCVLELVAHSVRRPRFELWVADADGLRRASEADAPCTYVGRVREWPGARASASLRADGLHVTVLGGPDGDTWSIQPAEHPGAPGMRLHVAYAGSELRLPPGFCEVLASSERAARAAGALPLLAGVQVAELAYDADFPYFLATGGTLRDTLAAIESTVLTSNLLYEHHIGVRTELVGGVVRTSEACDAAGQVTCSPYAGFHGDCFQLRAQFHNHWSFHFQHLQRDVAHLFTAQALTGPAIGCASIGGMCTSNAYAVSQRQYADLTTSLIVAHELGHIFGACHCTQDLPGNACNTYDPLECGIMASGVTAGPPGFGPAEAATLQARVAALGACLDPGLPSPPPVLLAVQPAQLEAFQGGPMVLTGDALDHALYVHVGATTLDRRQFDVLDPRMIVLEAPNATALGSTAVVVQGPGGSSQPQHFEFQETSPPRVDGEYDDLALLTGADHTWTFGGRPGTRLELRLAFDDVQVGAPGLRVLAHGTVLHSELLTGSGVGAYTQLIPFAWDGLDVWVQVVLLEGGQVVETSELLRHHAEF